MEDFREAPWYRQFWPWFVIALPAAAVSAGFVTLYLAGSEPAMVVDDYGQIARVTTQRVERARRASELGLAAKLNFYGGNDGRNGQITISLTRQTDAAAWPDSVMLQLVHPTREDLDRSVPLAGAEGIYSAAFSRPDGRYYLSLSDAEGSWRLTGELGRGADAVQLVAAGVAE